MLLTQHANQSSHDLVVSEINAWFSKETQPLAAVSPQLAGEFVSTVILASAWAEEQFPLVYRNILHGALCSYVSDRNWSVLKARIGIDMSARVFAWFATMELNTRPVSQ